MNRFSCRLQSPRLLLTLGLLSVCTKTVLAQPTASVQVLVVERPQELRVYNRYYQEITREEIALLRPYRPMLVVNTNVMLSDNFTRSMAIRIAGTTFYIEKADQKTLTNTVKAGVIDLLTNCETLSDTIRILQDTALSRMPTASVTDSRIAAGTPVRRFYRKAGKDYVESLLPNGGFGWGRFDRKTRGTVWESASSLPASLATQTGATTRNFRKLAEQRIIEMNTVLRELFELLNRQTDQSRGVPQWRITENDGRFSVALDDPTYARQFSESAQYLLNDLDGPARLQGYSVRFSDGVIQMTPKP